MAVKKKSLNEFKNELALYMPESEVAAVTHIVDSGKGSFYQDITGKQYLDFSSGIFTNNFGHGDAEITNTFSEIFGSLGNIHGRQWKGTLEVCRKLFKLLPSQNYQVIFYGDGGGYSCDRCLSELFYYFGKQKYNLVTFAGGFHGKTIGNKLSLDSNESANFFKVHTVSPPYCYRCPFGKNKNSCCFECVETLKKEMLNFKAQVFLFEPILGSSIIIPPKEYWQRVEKFCHDNEILMVADEVLVGGGRVGTFLASTYYGICPDVIILTKGLANGLPLSTILFNQKLTENKFSTRHLNYSSTFIGVPALIAVLGKILEKIERDDILENVKNRGKQFINGLKILQKKYPIIGEIRGIGLMAAIEIIKNDGTFIPDVEFTKKIFSAAEKNGLEIIVPTSHILRMAPPLNVTSTEIELGLNLIERSFENVCNG